jgi:HEAT repeat protein
VDVTGFEKEIVELVKDDKFGRARQMLVITLGKIGGRDAEDVAISALQDKDLVLHAIDALGAMHSVRAVSPLKELLHHNKPAVRKAAKKALQATARG